MFQLINKIGMIINSKVVQMAKITVRYLNGNTETFYGGTSIYNGKLYIWAPGQRKGKKPTKVIQLDQLHSKKRTGQKGIYISKY